MELSTFAATPGACRTFLTALALALGNPKEQADEIVRVFLIAVGTPTPQIRAHTLGTLGLREVTNTLALAADWARQFLRKASLPSGPVSYEHAESIGRFLFLIAYSETLGPTPGDETMDWYRNLVEQLGEVWHADAPAFVAHVNAACHESPEIT